MLKEGDPAPDFELADETGKPVRLADFRGKRVVLYFYPKADTPGCTVEACEFRDDVPSFGKKGAVVIGVSPDKPSAQTRFKQKYDLPFTLLADESKDVAKAYGVWKEKNLYGKKTMGVERSTFVIGRDGAIEKIYSKVKAQGHACKVLGDL